MNAADGFAVNSFAELFAKLRRSIGGSIGELQLSYTTEIHAFLVIRMIAVFEGIARKGGRSEIGAGGPDSWATLAHTLDLASDVPPVSMNITVREAVCA